MQAQAPENQTLKGHYAGFVSRLMAFIVDVIAVSFIVGAVTWFVSVTATVLQLRTFLGFSLRSVPGANAFIDSLFGPVSAGLFITFVIVVYHVAFLALVGQTPGKALIGLRVVTMDGKRLSYGRAFLRLVAYLVSGLPLYWGFLWVIFDDRRQAWHDKLTNTCVIYTWEARPDEKFLAEEIGELADGRVKDILTKN